MRCYTINIEKKIQTVVVFCVKPYETEVFLVLHILNSYFEVETPRVLRVMLRQRVS